MRDASIILVLVLLWQGGWFLAAAVRYLVTEGAPMAFMRRFWLSLISCTIPVIILYLANGTNFNHRQLWLAGSYNCIARLLPRRIEHLPEMIFVLGGFFLLVEFTLRTLFRKEQGRFIPVLLAIALWMTILSLVAVLAPPLREYIGGSLLLTLYLLILSLPSVAIMCGFWSGNGRIIYTSMAIFIAWHIVAGSLGYMFSSQFFVGDLFYVLR